MGLFKKKEETQPVYPGVPQFQPQQNFGQQPQYANPVQQMQNQPIGSSPAMVDLSQNADFNNIMRTIERQNQRFDVVEKGLKEIAEFIQTSHGGISDAIVRLIAVLEKDGSFGEEKGAKK